MTPVEIAHALEKHKQWRRGTRGGIKADLSLKNLDGFDLAGVDLLSHDEPTPPNVQAEVIKSFKPKADEE